MSFEEKGAWVYGGIAVLGYLTYIVLLLAQSGGEPLADAAYATPMLATIGGAIVVGIVANILLGIASPKEREKKDLRDRQIYRFGEYTGRALIVAGAVSALILAMFEADYFWISNVIYLAFVLSAVASTIARLVAYRRGFQPW